MPATVFDTEALAFTRDFEREFDAIREEYLNLNAPVLELHRNGAAEDFVERLKVHGENGWTPSWQVGSADPNHSWLTYVLSFQGWFPPEAEAKFPRTMRLLSHPAFETCAFSLLRPLTVLGPHAHSRLGGDRLTFHLGLDVDPGTSFLCVEGTFLEERNGGSVVFDGSRNHFAINASLKNRAILYIEFDRSKL
jgi:hypothetical protein